MEKRNFRTELKHTYSALVKRQVVVDHPSMDFLVIDEVGDSITGAGFTEQKKSLPKKIQ